MQVFELFAEAFPGVHSREELFIEDVISLNLDGA